MCVFTVMLDRLKGVAPTVLPFVLTAVRANGSEQRATWLIVKA